MIHSIGDSHAQWSFKGTGVVDHEIGPVTMGTVGKSRDGMLGSQLLDTIIERCGVEPTDTVIMCFGEIDTRCHIQPRVDAGEDEDQIIKELVDGYFQTIYGSRHLKFWVMSITPAWRKAEWSTFLAQNGRSEQTEQFPLRGEDVDRSRYVQKLNTALRQECQRGHVFFLDVHEHYCDAEGMLIPALSDGNLHIGNTSYVQKAVQHGIKTQGA